ncbi:MAG: 2Fe-2S iron-sulfur cluster-binding protein, partial [Fusobacteriaceae bacterium]
MKVNIKNHGEIHCDKGQNLLEILRENNIFINSDCGGISNKCGKCKIKILNSTVPDVKLEEKILLTKKELDEGYRLACMLKIEQD